MSSAYLKDQVDILFNHKSIRWPYKVHYGKSWQWRKHPLLGHPSVPPIPTTIYTPLCIENLHILTGIRTGIQTIQYLPKVNYISTDPQSQSSLFHPRAITREMDYLNKVLCRNSYPDWFLKKNNNKSQRDQAPTQETNE